MSPENYLEARLDPSREQGYKLSMLLTELVFCFDNSKLWHQGRKDSVPQATNGHGHSPECR